MWGHVITRATSSLLLLLQTCLHTPSNFKQRTLETIEQLFERAQEPRNVELRDSIILQQVGRIFCNAFQQLFKGAVKIINLLVEVGENYSNGSRQLAKISNVVELLLAHKWDPGGLTRDGWNPSDTKRDEDISAHASARESQGIRTYHYYRVLSLNLQLIISLVGYYGGASMGFEKGNTTYAIKRFQDISTVIVTRAFDVVAEMEAALQPIGPDHISMGIITIGPLMKAGASAGQVELVKGVYMMIQQVAHGDVKVLNNWNEILLFHNFISHQVIMLALFVILNCEWGAQSGGSRENIIQVRLQNRKEMLSDGGKMTRKFLHQDYWMKLEGQVGYGVMSYQSSTSLDFVRWKALHQWDPGGLCWVIINHLEDKVSFKGGGVDANKVNEGKGILGIFRKLMKERSGNQSLGDWGPQAHTTI